MHLISVDLPAPLSPTSAITSPWRTSKSTSVSAWTEPNDFETPRSSRRGWSLTGCVSYHRRTDGGGPSGRLRRIRQLLLAVLRVGAVADVALLQEARSEEHLVVRLRDRLRCDQHRGLETAALRLDRARLRDVLALDDGDRRRRRRRRFLAHVLEHRHRLPARDDVLDALRGRILTAERNRLQLVRLERDDDRIRDAVVRRGDAVDLVTRLDEHLLEDRAGLLIAPTGHELIRALLQRAALVQRAEHGVVAALEQECVRIFLAAVELGDDSTLLGLQGVGDGRALEDADARVVERHIERGRAALDLTVVVDRLDALRTGGLLDRRGGAGVDRRDDEDLRTVGDALVGLRLLLLRVALSVHDARRNAGRLERLDQCRLVELLPADRRLRVRHQTADLDPGGLLANAGASTARGERRHNGAHD